MWRDWGSEWTVTWQKSCKRQQRHCCHHYGPSGSAASPRLFTNASYFKTKLACYDCIVPFSCRRSRYLWHQGQGNNFACCISVCLVTVANNSPIPVTTIILYSNDCCYQNKNGLFKIASFTFCTNWPHTTAEVASSRSYLDWPGWQATCSCREEAAWQISVLAFASARQHPKSYAVKNVDHTFFNDFSKIQH